ncbi:DUF3999 domain-containing protein [Candidatus Electronema halotolerans]
MKRLLVLCLLLIAAPCLAADQPLHREDFAYSMDLTVSGRSAIYSLTLPAEIYKGCTRSDLGDLRVFNAHGPVPHLLRQPQAKQTEQPAQTLPFFPLAESTNTGSKPADLGIAIGGNGAIITFSTGGAEQKAHAVSTYLLDASALEHSPDWLEFAWTGGQFSASVRLESSDDLNSWRRLVSSAALAELRFGGHDLLRQRIDLGQRTAGKYLRLSWPQGKDGIRLTAVKAGYANEIQSQPRALLTLLGQPDSAAKPGRAAWLYETEGVFPADQLNIRLPEQNALAEFAVFSRVDEQAAWRRRGSLLAWRLTVDGTQFDNEALRFAPVADRFWRLESEAGSNTAPVLELGWLPGQLLFLAQGEGPYSLVYGKTGLLPVRSQVARLLRDAEPLKGSKLIEAAHAGPEKVLAGAAALQPQRTIPWRLWLLWAGLLAGVLAVAAMALKLWREMQKR